MQKYNKLIRDNIPTILDGKGVKHKTHTAEEQEYITKLKEKLSEEVSEYLEANSVEELADILEVVYALGELHQTDMNKLEALRNNKVLERGAFKKRLILEETE